MHALQGVGSRPTLRKARCRLRGLSSRLSRALRLPAMRRVGGRQRAPSDFIGGRYWDRNQWPLPCETGGRGLQNNHMRAPSPIATGTWHHVVSRDITQCHDPGRTASLAFPPAATVRHDSITTGSLGDAKLTISGYDPSAAWSVEHATAARGSNGSPNCCNHTVLCEPARDRTSDHRDLAALRAGGELHRNPGVSG